jgi:hypothetical protein
VVKISDQVTTPTACTKNSDRDRGIGIRGHNQVG